MSAMVKNEMLDKMVALREFAMVNARVCDLVKGEETAEALGKLLENFGFIPCASEAELGKVGWEEFLATEECCMKTDLSDFEMLAPFINYSAYGKFYYSKIEDEHELVYWGSTGVIFNLD